MEYDAAIGWPRGRGNVRQGELRRFRCFLFRQVMLFALMIGEEPAINEVFDDSSQSLGIDRIE
jgi:hypothetical protein